MGQVLRQVGLCGVDRKKEMREEGKGWDQGQTGQLAYPKISYGPPTSWAYLWDGSGSVLYIQPSRLNPIDGQRGSNM